MELLQQLEKLEREQNTQNKENNAQKSEINSDIPSELKKDLLDNLQNLFKD
ncbi:hypothetical protein [Enterococcus faecium]|uniref:Uncharacterized protein n=1 Tax=Enterococcus faecium TaxID=1352 RepID=A0A2S0T1L5_ENTFC|nr:hypothetical protein [Enterococcus faecium]MCZ1753747.1 hypothetical protein [Enterococcus faecium]